MSKFSQWLERDATTATNTVKLIDVALAKIEKGPMQVLCGRDAAGHLSTSDRRIVAVSFKEAGIQGTLAGRAAGRQLRELMRTVIAEGKFTDDFWGLDTRHPRVPLLSHIEIKCPNPEQLKNVLEKIKTDLAPQLTTEHAAPGR